MKKLITILLLSIGCWSGVFAEQGQVSLNFNHLMAYDNGGMRDFNQQDNQLCVTKYAATLPSKMIFFYAIDPKTQSQIGRAKIDSGSVDLFPEGLTNRYSFMSDDVSPLSNHNVLRITANIDQAFQRADANIMLKGRKSFSCVASAASLVKNH